MGTDNPLVPPSPENESLDLPPNDEDLLTPSLELEDNPPAEERRIEFPTPLVLEEKNAVPEPETPVAAALPVKTAIEVSKPSVPLETSVEAPKPPLPRRAAKKEARRLAKYADIRREQFELLNKLLDTLARVDDFPEAQMEQVRDAVFHADHPFLLTLVGPFSSGKSSVINALLGETVLEVGPVPTTDHIAILRYGPTVQKTRTGDVSTIFYPAELLERLSLVDTPGLESVFKEHDDLTQRFLHRADIVLLVMIATQVLTAGNLEFMQHLKEYGKRLIIVVNQIDLLEPEDQVTVEDFVREQSRIHIGIEPVVWLVSSKQARTAYETTPRDEIIWDESGFADIEEYLDETLDDAERIRQKLETPLQVAQNANREALKNVREGQAALGEHKKTVDNIEAQILASEKERQKIIEKSFGEIDREWQATIDNGTKAIAELFHLSRAVSQVGAGFGEIIALGTLIRRFRKQTTSEEAFSRHEVRESLQRAATAAEKLGPAIEGRDLEDMDHLVDYTRDQMRRLPDTLQQKVIGKVQSPLNYDRKALRNIRGELDDLVKKASVFETSRLDRALRSTIVLIAFWEFLVILLAVLVATGQFSATGSGVLSIILIMALAVIGLLFLPIRGWSLQRAYENRLTEIRDRYKVILDRATKEQIAYGTQLRRDSVSPFTRLISTQTEITDELKQELEVHERAIVRLQHSLSALLKD
ncbi:MAG: dynamin family protein [Chloroflexi bacterium]|nr:dynamin family protein [Chloroflexota bacterium]